MTTKYIVANNTVKIMDVNSSNFFDKLPTQVYSVSFVPFQGFLLEQMQHRLDQPKKLYGTINARVDKCLSTYKQREGSTGILLTGYKGTGKTLCMTVLANRVMDELDIPVVMVREAFAGPDFENFIKSIGECCLLFDEFGKVYPINSRSSESGADAQSSLLTLLDGIDKTKRLSILTENSLTSVNSFLLDRPSRIFYHFEYYKLEEKSIIDFCKGSKVPKLVTDELLDISRHTRVFSFDMMQSLVEEAVRYSISVAEAAKDLNVDVTKANDYIKIVSVIDKNDVDRLITFPKDPMRRPDGEYNGTEIDVYFPNELDSKTKRPEWDAIYLSNEALIYSDTKKDVYQTGSFIVTVKAAKAPVYQRLY